MRKLSISVASLILLVSAPTAPAQDPNPALMASQSLTIQPNGPRSGESGSKYFNVEGKDNEKFASFGVLVFEMPKDTQDKKLKGLTLTLVQSVPKFAKDGELKFFLAPDLDPKGDLKFDPKVPDGIGGQIKGLITLGSGRFKKVETGTTESFSLALDDAVRQRIAKSGKLCLVIVPADAVVAATYFGASEAARDKSPKLSLDLQ
jgi:hypothetical protein